MTFQRGEQDILRNNRQLGDEMHPVVYVDETYIHPTYTVLKCWQSEDIRGVLDSESVGQRWIIVHSGGEMGFIKDALLIFKAKSSTGDYHDSMNAENFQRWVTEKLLPNNSIVVMDNASYHSIQKNKASIMSNRIAEMKSWLLERGIPFDVDMRKSQLYELILTHKGPKKFRNRGTGVGFFELYYHQIGFPNN